MGLLSSPLCPDNLFSPTLMPRVVLTPGWLLRQMMRALLLGLAAGLVVGVLALRSEAQPVGPGGACQADLDVARAAVDEGYAGRGRYTPDEERVLAERTAALRAEAAETESAVACDGVLRAWAALHGDRHLYVSLRRARPGTETPEMGRPQTPSLDFVGDRAAVLRVPSFGVRYKRAIDSLLAVHHDRLHSTPHLVVDVRGNGGGGDSAFDGIAALLYTGPFSLAGAEVYASEGNTAFYAALSSDGGLPEDVRTWAGDLAALMRTRPGGFVEFAGEQRAERDAVYRYPQAVAVLVDGRVASATEEFVLHARHSAKTVVLGDTTRGALDYANLRTVPLPSGERDLEMPTTRRSWLPGFSVDRAGLAPDVAIPAGVADWVSYALGYLEAAPPGPPRHHGEPR